MARSTSMYFALRAAWKAVQNDLPGRFVEPTGAGSAIPLRCQIKKPRKGAFLFGGGGGIRTHEARESLPVFKTGAIDHSATPPRPRSLAWMAGAAESQGRSSPDGLRVEVGREQLDAVQVLEHHRHDLGLGSRLTCHKAWAGQVSGALHQFASRRRCPLTCIQRSAWIAPLALLMNAACERCTPGAICCGLMTPKELA